MITTMNTTKPGCPSQCGGLTVPYPFGIGPGSGCAMDSRYEITCNTSYTPPKAFLQAPEPTVKYPQERRSAKASGEDNCIESIGTTHDDKRTLTCNSECFDAGDIGKGCRGKGCCQTSVFYGINGLDDSISIVLNWSVENGSCSQTQEIISSYACQLNTKCFDAEHYATGYSCSCLPGYEGNPYLSPGCKDINECGEDPNDHGPCTRNCTNTMGSYICSCPPGYLGDGMKNGTSCFKQHLRFPIGKFMLGKVPQRRVPLKQLLSEMDKESIEETEIFSIEQLRVATKNFDDDHIIGKGGSRAVYKGSLSDGRVVAINKSKTVDEKQIEQFINEVAILTRLSQRNLVKILGCCLETEVPILVYEFIMNGTLYEHIHAKGGHPWLSWDNCLRIATELANALCCLNSNHT
ncbi:Wall-associated receptor kinase 2-like protein [Drosera capensis]